MRLFYTLLFAGLFVSIFLSAKSIHAQTPEGEDRLARVKDLVSNSELVLLWSEGEKNADPYSYQKIYNLDLTQPNIDQRLVPGPLQSDSIVTGNQQMAVATGNFSGSQFKHFVAAWPGNDNSISVVIPNIDAGTLGWEDANRLTVPGPLESYNSGQIHLAAGDFTGDRNDDFVLAYHGADSTVHLQIFSFNPGSLIPVTKDSINDEKIYLPQDRWDIVSGDFNSDGSDEIALLMVKSYGESDWAMYIKLYSVDGSGKLFSMGSKVIYPDPNYPISSINISGAAGDLDNDPALEIVYGFSFSQDYPDSADTYLYLIDVEDNLNTIVSSDLNRIAVDTQNESDLAPFNIATGDLNGDYTDEIVLFTAGNYRVYEMDENQKPQQRVSGGGPRTEENDASTSFLAVNDMDGDGSEEIVMATNFIKVEPGEMQYLQIDVVSIDTALSKSTKKASRLSERPVSNNWPDRHFAIALGDFNGDRTWLGSPVHYRRTDVMRPSVILNSPPVHYDILDSIIYDVSGCYPDQSCGFYSTYTQTSSNEETASIEVHQDWGASASLEIIAPGSKHKLEAIYGEKFSKKGTDSQKMTISSGRTAAGDDWIYANTFDIDFYEYPVYDGQDPTPIGYFMVSVPGVSRPLWIETKDDMLLSNNFRPDHEVGNILSYRSRNTSDVSSPIVTFDEQTIGSTGDSYVSLEYSTFSANSAEKSRDFGFSQNSSFGENVDFYGIEIGFEIAAGVRYGEGEIVTQTVSVASSLEMRADLGHLKTEYGTSATYQVQPYAYWTAYGALAIDYKVSIPEGNNFWHEKYGGKTDLAFSLPWRYDQKKGIPFPGNDPSYRYRTRDIILSDSEPKGGETVTIGARLRNMGLEAVTVPVIVQFYLGDPAADGELITQTILDTVIASQESHNVFVDWEIPVNTALVDARIYVVLDPQALLKNEVHYDNNVGWAPVVSLGTPTRIELSEKTPKQFILHQAYPNPFNPSTTIRFDLHMKAHTSIKIYNIRGQEIVTLIDEVYSAGNHQVQFNASGLASGLYFYQFIVEPVNDKANSFMQTRKVVFMK